MVTWLAVWVACRFDNRGRYDNRDPNGRPPRRTSSRRKHYSPGRQFRPGPDPELLDEPMTHFPNNFSRPMLKKLPAKQVKAVPMPPVTIGPDDSQPPTPKPRIRCKAPLDMGGTPRPGEGPPCCDCELLHSLHMLLMPPFWEQDLVPEFYLTSNSKT